VVVVGLTAKKNTGTRKTEPTSPVKTGHHHLPFNRIPIPIHKILSSFLYLYPFF